jgi:RNA polymerase sigma-70 factor (ECF subfamily)
MADSAPEFVGGDSDETLATRQDRASFVELTRRYLTPVYRYAIARLGRAADAEDATTEVFDRAWSRRAGFRPGGTYRAWLFAIAARVITEHYRRRAAQRDLADLTDALESPGFEGEAGALRNERLREARRLLDPLAPGPQEILRLRLFGGLTYGEVASVVGESEGRVKNVASEALRQLRAEYRGAVEPFG